jgi:hypothetical protein
MSLFKRREASPPPGPAAKLGMFSGFAPPVQVVGFVSTRTGDAERGPQIRMRSDDAVIRLVSAGELVRVLTPRRAELAEVAIDDTLPRGGVVLRDVVGASPSELVRIVRLDTDAPARA